MQSVVSDLQLGFGVSELLTESKRAKRGGGGSEEGQVYLFLS